jgi:YgiT-type zinc finger domain-containing protein
MKNQTNETLVEKRVTYSLEINGKFYLIENVPARVNPETGEQFFSAPTVERLQEIIFDEQEPVRFVETPVYNFAT